MRVRPDMRLSAANLARSFAALRPLSLLGATRLFERLVARWSVRPTITRPWQAALTHQAWLGRVPRLSYRLRRPKFATEAGARTAMPMARTSPPDTWQALSDVEDGFDEGREGASPFDVAATET